MIVQTIKLPRRHGSSPRASQPPEPCKQVAPAKPPRKGHKKSRGGCFHCKRRKIKCQENRPICHNCKKMQFKCVYPVDDELKSKELVPHPKEVVNLQSTPTLFTMTDMRLFHHFLFNATPHLPLANERIWQTDVASYAHHYDFLIHAVLGFAASHLALTSNPELRVQALSHRVKGIESLNKALAGPPESKAHSDSILATCYVLTLQSSYIGESAEEYLTMLRGSQLVASQGWDQKLGTSFNFIDLKAVAKQVRAASANPSNIRIFSEKEMLAARPAIENIAPLCQSSIEKLFHGWLSEVVNTPNISSLDIYNNLCDFLISISNEDFSRLIDPSNPVMQILMGQFVAINNLIYPLKLGESFEFNGRYLGKPNRSSIFRLQSVCKNVPSSLHQYLEWPKQHASL